MTKSLGYWGAILALNASLAYLIHAAAPAQPRLSDRQEYEYAGQYGFAPACPKSIYCYRLLVPMLLERLPVDPERRWRWYQVAANTAAGSIVAWTTSALAPAIGAPIVATLMVQTSYGFSFTAYDPYTADPMVFAFSAFIAWCWLSNRRIAALVAGIVGVFAKETVALVTVATALAALMDRERAGWRMWIANSAAACGILLAFHWIMDTYFGWSLAANPAAQFSQGSWLAIWWANNPSLLRKAFLVFVPFGFAWLYALAGLALATRRLRQLAAGTVWPILVLTYVQTPERALSNAFFVVIPLAAIVLARLPLGIAVTAAVANGALTAKAGSSTAFLPSSGYLLIPAVASAAWVVWHLSGGRPSRASTASRRLSKGHEA